MSQVFFLLFTTLICCLGGFASDINAPSMTSIANTLSTTIDQVQLSMTLFITGFSVSQLIYGPITDSVGRKKPLGSGLIIFIIGSMVASMAQSIQLLIIARLTQGIGAGATACIWRALFIDRFNQQEVVIYAGYLQLCMLFIIPLGPFLGGMLDTIFSWRASFLFMIFYGAVCLLLMQHLSEKNIEQPKPLNICTILSRYKKIITHPIFYKYMYCASAGYGAFFSWYIVGPVLTGLNASDFGIYNLCIAFPSILISSQVNKRFVKQLGSNKLIQAGLLCLLTASLVIALSQYLQSPLVLFLAYFFIMTGSMIALANTFSCAFQPFDHIAGSAAGLYGGIQQLGAIITGLILSIIPEHTAYPFAIVVLFISLSTLWVLYRLNSKL